MFASKDLFFTRPSGYQISRSVRLRSSASGSFTRTLSASGTTDTWSMWVKRGKLGTAQALFDYSNASTSSFGIEFTSGDAITLYSYSSAFVLQLITTAVYRDPSAWYHIVCVIDTTQATSTNRAKIYVNGVQVTAFSTATYPAQNTSLNIANSVTYGIGVTGTANSQYLDGYLTEINFIDGQALTPSSFGQTNSVTGVWQPIKYTGTYGTNGFYLNFSDNSNNTAATIGKDNSGNGNNWTPNNISVTAGATYDSMLDVPTPYADGGNGRGNYSVLNPLDWGTTNFPCTNGNLTWTTTTTATGFTRGTTGMTTGKWYWEVLATSVGSGSAGVGIAKDGSTVFSTGQALYTSNTGNKYIDGTTTAYGATWATNNLIGVAYDADAGQITFYKDNVSQGAITLSGYAGVSVCPVVVDGSSLAFTLDANFGQRPFSYTPPTGYVALNTQNLPTPTISNGANYMAATTYTGTGSSLTIANTVGSTSFQPDFVWVKGRSGATDHALYDSVRGTTKDLVSNSTAAETTQATGLTAFGSTGFTIGALAKMNTNTATYVGWQWKASGSTVSNTSGSITSTVSAGATQGFSVVTYTGTGANATVGHGLGVAPKMMIFKVRSTTNDWAVYHSGLATPATQALFLNLTNAVESGVSAWNSTAPTSSVFSIGVSSPVNVNAATFVAYCFSEVAGYSKFGSYTGNGSADGPFVYLGFRPRFVMVKNASTAATDWITLDSARDTYNVTTKYLKPNLADAEGSGSGMQFLSNGFKWQNDTGTSVNQSGATFIYMAFAENPFKNSLAR
jgi:hypothetical protein